ncbi:DNA mismatch repair endonuclease MutL [Geobacillus subterraneus]|uniref:DNA mismatch repair endonuclease MutL n=1 Tax=Geobacillus subterraneus TaxID=129338 RepID=UPI001442E436|nr:DNA mismatch repair endonuclease MutL [Geobacillus subterraneus]QIZ67407.1 DNA mismatch repair endonuclease MutL [Geobacillus subterraneus]WPZ19596.1 DNA mismatch repair endonuclease MutL [Geobacillus subterraneus]
MGRIRKLDDQLANKIAAGEVVERPASVVKELVENAIDAHSTVIDIELEEAGMTKIRIIDNGDGMEEDDCLLAFERHATSKIQDEHDLFRIRTLGFRGEALPSIASVSEVELVTSTGRGPGTKLVLQGGALISCERAAGRKGTDITVSNLFFNTPARLKYMKTIHTELGHAADVVNRLALAHPDVSFRLRHHGKTLLATNGSGDVRHVLAAIYGMETAKQMIPLEAESLDFTVRGYVSLPEVTRASRNYISLIVNGRYVRNMPLMKAIEAGYHTLLPIGRYPIVFLAIDMDPVLVDVNVHPAKLEVRFSKEAELNELVTAAIRQAFRRRTLIPSVSADSKTAKAKAEQAAWTLAHRVHEPAAPLDGKAGETSDVTAAAPLAGKETLGPPPAAAQADAPARWEEAAAPIISEKKAGADDAFTAEPKPAAEAGEKPAAHLPDTGRADGKPAADRLPPLYPIGQLHGTYILAENEHGLYMIDQHAAQERVNYEYFREKLGEVTNEVQELLVPLTFEYPADEYERIAACRDELARCGVFLEPFGLRAFLVRSHPVWFPKGKEKEIIEEMIEHVLAAKTVDIKQLREQAAIMMSCKRAIKANQHLRNDEIFVLLEALRKTTDPFTCPHGRPIIVHFSTYEIEKLFKRVM